MQNPQNPKKTTSFIKSAPALSVVVPASRKNRLGTSTKSCSNLATQAFQKIPETEKLKSYRKFT
ncbi:replication protein, partial [Acinetobacter sp. ULE_I024]